MGRRGQQTLTIANPGGVSLYISDIRVEGPAAGDFSVSPTSARVPPRGRVNFAVVFAPSSSGAKSASLKIEHNAVGGTASVALSGGAVSPLTIFTVAGTGTAGYDAIQAATQAKLNNPAGVAVDKAGNLYLADAQNHVVRKVDLQGTISIVAGTAGKAGFAGDGKKATLAQLNNPWAVAVDKAGNLYIADGKNNRVRKVDATTQNISTIAGTGTPGYSGDGALAARAGLNSPTGVAVDRDGNVYIADFGNHRVRKVDVATNNISTVAGEGAAGQAGTPEFQPLNPWGVWVDGAGNNLYIADWGQHRVLKVSPTGTRIVAGTGTPGFSRDVTQANLAPLNFPYGVALDKAGNVYIADGFNHCIRKVDKQGKISTFAGQGGTSGGVGDNSLAARARLNSPTGVAVDQDGNVYIADHNNHSIRKVVVAPSTGAVAAKPAAEAEAVLPRFTSLGLNYPNPFNPTTQIPYTLAASGEVTLKIYNVLGQQIRVLAQGYQPAGGGTRWAGTGGTSRGRRWRAGCTCTSCGPARWCRADACCCSSSRAAGPLYRLPGTAYIRQR